jgi:hypothetical protein
MVLVIMFFWIFLAVCKFFVRPALQFLWFMALQFAMNFCAGLLFVHKVRRAPLVEIDPVELSDVAQRA